jgi:hypothetical protein
MICENCKSKNTAILYKGVYGCFDCFCSFKIKTMAKKAITITVDEQVILDAKKRFLKDEHIGDDALVNER